VDASAEVVGDVQRRLAALGLYDGASTGDLNEATQVALADWAGRHNLEGRLRDDGRLSTHLLMELRDVTPEVGRSATEDAS